MKKFLINLLYFTLIITLTFAVSAFALVNKVTSYQTIKQPIEIEVVKQEVQIMNQAIGKLDAVYVEEGDFVQADQLIAKIDDTQILSRIFALEAKADNQSAQTEAEVLRSQLPSFELRAPRAGIVYKIHSARGSYLGGLTPVATIYANDETKLVAYVMEDQYAELKQESQLSAFSPRFEQSYPIKVKGVSKVETTPGTIDRKYELNLLFANPDEGIAFLQGESLELLGRKENTIALKPAEVITEWFKQYLPQLTNTPEV